MARPAGAVANGFVVDEPLGFEPLEVLAGGTDGEEGVGGELFDLRGIEAAEGDEHGAAGGVEEVEAGSLWGHGGCSMRRLMAAGVEPGVPE